MNAEKLNLVSAILFMWSDDIEYSRKNADSADLDAFLAHQARKLEDWSRAVLEEGLGGERFRPSLSQLLSFRALCNDRFSAHLLGFMPFIPLSEEYWARKPCEEQACLIEWASWNVRRRCDGKG